jgi:hypothetical protein
VTERIWHVSPGTGIGPLRFGTPRAELRAAFGICRPFRRGAGSRDLTDQFGPDGDLMLTSSTEDGLYFIEIADPTGVYLGEVELAGRAPDVVARLRRAGARVERDDAGWSIDGGAALLYCPTSTIEAVSAYAPRWAGAAMTEFDEGPHATPPPGHYTVIPRHGLEGLALGTPRDEVRATRGPGVGFAPWPAASDSFFDEGLEVEYDAQDRTERITVTRAAAARLGDVNLLPSSPRTIADVRAALESAGHQVAEAEAALILPELGVEVWTARPGPKRPVCAVSVTAAQ